MWTIHPAPEVDAPSQRAGVDRESEIPGEGSSVLRPGRIAPRKRVDPALERLASGVPAIPRPTNGTKDYVGETSIVFDAYTPNAVCAALAAMIDRLDRDDGAIARACIEQARKAFDPDSIALCIIKIVRLSIESKASGQNNIKR